MKRILKLAFTAAVSSGLLIGCATPEPAYTPSPFTPVKIDTSGYVPKVSAFAVIVDASSSMGGDHIRKFLYEKDVANRMNQTIPPLDYEASVIAFGTGSCVKNMMAWKVTGPAQYKESDIAGAIDAVKCTSGWSPLEDAIASASEVLTPVAGHSALFIFSDFKELDRTAVVAGVQDLKSSLGPRLCVYPVQIGDNTGGRTLADELAAIGGCGPAVNADAIASSNGMADFVRGAFLAPAPPPPAPVAVDGDADGDGVPDSRDKCPNTPRGVKVTSEGCWVLSGKDVLFDFNSARIKDTYVLDEAAKILLANPEITGELRGHTDSVGPEEYNMQLSKRRAEAVHEYFVKKGVARERLRAVGYGESSPVASNDTPEGRHLNRRVELRAD
jgi:OOP family OmpA-OmpF porin